MDNPQTNQTPAEEAGVKVKAKGDKALVYNGEPWAILVTFISEASEDIEKIKTLIENDSIKSVEIVEINEEGNIVDKILEVDSTEYTAYLFYGPNNLWMKIEGIDANAIIRQITEVLEGSMKISEYINYVLDEVVDQVLESTNEIKNTVKCILNPDSCHPL